MELIAGLVSGIITGVILLLIVVKGKNTHLKNQNQTIEKLNNALAEANREKSALQIENAKIAIASQTKAQLFTEKIGEIESLKTQIERLLSEREELVKSNSSLLADCEAKKSMLAEKEADIEKRIKQQKEQFEEQTKNLRFQFVELSQKLLKEKSDELDKTNRANIAPIIDKLKEEVTRVGNEIKDTREKNLEQKTSLDAVIREMMARTTEIGNEANKLADALKGKSKTQGLYGELVLTEILRRSGLKEGEHFDCQTMIRDSKGNVVVNEETNKRMIPDVVVHYPDKDLIIDSKVSLTAYIDWCNATTDEERTMAQKRHIASIKSHIKEIVTKSYATYQKQSNRGTIDCVVMFIPNEGALQLMRETEHSLWYEAYDQKVIITSELSLFALLKMIENYWAQVEQQRNQDSIIRSAENMLGRVVELYKLISDMQALFGKVEEQFSKVKKKLHDGNQSIATSANQLMRLGVKSTKADKQIFMSSESDDTTKEK